MDMPKDAGRFSPFVNDLLAPGRYPDLLEGQHEARAWEYGMALEAILQWGNAEHPRAHSGPLEILDAGSASSNLWQALIAFTSEDIIRVDPNFSAGAEKYGQQVQHGCALHEYRKIRGEGASVDVLLAISVIEHIPDHQLLPFFQAAYDLLRPGGLFFLTTDYWNDPHGDGKDRAHFHWMRERIYTPAALIAQGVQLSKIGFVTFGDTAHIQPWPGPQLYDYAMASVACTKGFLS